jgi:hypothetical protein
LRSRVFISCGQNSTREVEIARRVAKLLHNRGFDPYVAKEVQNVFEINSGVIGELKNSDCYLFINFRREPIDREHRELYRGSLFSNQEFAAAYALGFDKIIVVNEKGVRSEGMLRYIGCNTEAFDTDDECLDVVEHALDLSGWEPGYSRRLWTEQLRLESAKYIHFTEEVMDGRFLSLDIANRRADLAAMETSGRLVGFRRRSEQSWISSSPFHRSLLKASGRKGFSHTVFPKSSEAFNILFMGSLFRSHAEPADGVYLNSALDVTPNPPLPLNPGEWELRYEFCAIGFPLLCVEVVLRYSAFDDIEAELLRQYTPATPAEMLLGTTSVK